MDSLQATERHLFFTGKGGVGKTTLTVAIATELVRLGHHVHLTTTDPAAHVAATMDTAVPGLELSRIDPKAETEAYREEVLRAASSTLDADGRAIHSSRECYS